MRLQKNKITVVAPVLVAVLLLAWLSAGSAEAEESIPSEETFLSDVPLVLTVTRLAQPKSETPAAVTVI